MRHDMRHKSLRALKEGKVPSHETCPSSPVRSRHCTSALRQRISRPTVSRGRQTSLAALLSRLHLRRMRRGRNGRRHSCVVASCADATTPISHAGAFRQAMAELHNNCLGSAMHEQLLILTDALLHQQPAACRGCLTPPSVVNSTAPATAPALCADAH